MWICLWGYLIVCIFINTLNDCSGTQLSNRNTCLLSLAWKTLLHTHKATFSPGPIPGFWPKTLLNISATVHAWPGLLCWWECHSRVSGLCLRSCWLCFLGPRQRPHTPACSRHSANQRCLSGLSSHLQILSSLLLCLWPPLPHFPHTRPQSLQTTQSGPTSGLWSLSRL